MGDKKDKSDNGKQRILLVGRSGNGLSSCCDSINRGQIKDKKFIAVKCPGVGDNVEDRQLDILSVIKNVKREMAHSRGSAPIKAIALVLKYGVRFTKQERDAVENVKLMFGNDVFRNYGMIIMTYGDLFEMDNKDNDGRTWIDWCGAQTGDIQTLFQEVSYRVVLFDNKTKVLADIRKQLDSLNKCINEINAEYTIVQFDHVVQGRKKLLSRERMDADLSPASESSSKQEELKRKCLHVNNIIIILCVFLLCLFLVLTITYIVYINKQ